MGDREHIEKDEGKKLEKITDEEIMLDIDIAGVPEVDVVVLKCPVEGCDYVVFVPEYDPSSIPVCPHHGKKLRLVIKNG